MPENALLFEKNKLPSRFTPVTVQYVYPLGTTLRLTPVGTLCRCFVFLPPFPLQHVTHPHGGHRNGLVLSLQSTVYIVLCIMFFPSWRFSGLTATEGRRTDPVALIRLAYLFGTSIFSE